jgi:hypothetical protein
MEKAKHVGVGVVTMFNTGHFGAIAAPAGQEAPVLGTGSATPGDSIERLGPFVNRSRAGDQNGFMMAR